jgi:hypothetical protein
MIMPRLEPRSIKASLSALESALGELEEADADVIEAADLEAAVRRIEEIAGQATKDSESDEEDEDEGDDDEDEDETE